VTTDAFEARTFDEPDDEMVFPHGHAEVVAIVASRLPGSGVRKLIWSPWI
jgi:hypothetical protein